MTRKGELTSIALVLTIVSTLMGAWFGYVQGDGAPIKPVKKLPSRKHGTEFVW